MPILFLSIAICHPRVMTLHPFPSSLKAENNVHTPIFSLIPSAPPFHTSPHPPSLFGSAKSCCCSVAALPHLLHASFSAHNPLSSPPHSPHTNSPSFPPSPPLFSANKLPLLLFFSPLPDDTAPEKETEAPSPFFYFPSSLGKMKPSLSYELISSSSLLTCCVFRKESNYGIDRDELEENRSSTLVAPPLSY